MLYSFIKAAHLLSLFVWIGGMVAVALALRYPAQIHIKQLKAYDRAVTTPAMIVALGFGIFLGVQGDWFTSTWLGLKIIFVLLLSGLHGALVGKLRRAVSATSNDLAPAGMLFLPIGGVMLAIIVLLVTIKP